MDVVSNNNWNFPQSSVLQPNGCTVLLCILHHPLTLYSDAHFTSHYSILHIGIHQMHDKMVLLMMWSHLTTKSSQIGSKSRIMILHFGNSMHAFTCVMCNVCVMASCMPSSLTGQLFLNYISIKNYCFLWILTCFLVWFLWFIDFQSHKLKVASNILRISASTSGLLDLIFKTETIGAFDFKRRFTEWSVYYIKVQQER